MSTAISKEVLLSMYQKMLLIRRFEERAGQQYGLGKIAGFCHLYIGQEAVAVGAAEAMRKDDYMLSGYREHGQALARGSHPGMVMAELFGRNAGYSKGKGGSMHIFDIENHFYGGYGIVGGQIPLATGMGFASRYRNEDRVTVVFFGDAASNQGSFHESLNMASKWKLPVIYVCENNRYGMGTAFERVTAEFEVYKRASAYRMRGEPVDGMDAVAMYQTLSDCLEYCRAGQGPVLLEANTYRFRGHSMADPATYRSKSEVESEKESNDPIPKLAKLLLQKKYATSEQLEQIDVEMKKASEEAVKFAEASPEPSLDELWRDVIVEEGESDVRPRERVLGAQDVSWPTYPSGAELKVTWDLEPAAPAPTPIKSPTAKNGTKAHKEAH